MPKGGFWSRRGWQSGGRPPAAAKRGSKNSGAPASMKELQRRAEFCKAVRAYDWEGALALDPTEQEKTDVADSKNRVEWMEYFLGQGDSVQALLYAITSEERRRAESGGRRAEPLEDVAAVPQHRAQSDDTTTANAAAVKELVPLSRRRSTISRIGSAIGNSMRRKSSKAAEASSKASGGEVHLQAGRV